jgi:protein SDA1
LEKLFRKLRQSGDRFEVKLLQMNFISRLLGCHELQLLTFYSFVQRYLTSHQRDVTIILTYLIQACHDKVPPEDLMPVVKSIAYHFITDRCTEEQITVGLNAVREIFARVPALLHEPDMDSFVQDLAMYAKKNHKSIMIAANGVVNLVRKIYPGLLKNKDKGRLGKEEAKGGVMPLGFGETEVASGVEGTELLEAYERGEIALDGDDLVWTDGKGPNGDADGWKDVSEDEDVEGGDSETEYLTDEDDEEEPSLIAVAEESKIKPLVEWGEEGEQDSDEESDEYEMMGEESEEESGEESGEEEAENDGWEEVEEGAESSDDEDEEEGGEKEAPLSTEAKAEATKARLESTRLLTQDDFDLLARLKTAYAEKAKDPRFRAIQQKMLKVQSRHSKRKLEDTDSDEEGPSRSYKYNSSNLVPVGRVGSRADVKIETLQALVAGRKESKWEHEGHKGGLTNLEKQRKKNYVMVRKGKKSVAGKLSKSNSASRYENSKKKEVFGRDLRKRRRT